jgi:hypothetical protein
MAWRLLLGLATETVVRESYGRKSGSIKTVMSRTNERLRIPKVSFRAVFHQGDGSRLAIGTFNRPLLEEECRSLEQAWQVSALPEVEDFEVSRKQVSFLARSYRVDAAWRSIDSLLAASSALAEAS